MTWSHIGLQAVHGSKLVESQDKRHGKTLFSIFWYMDVSKNRGKTPKKEGGNKWKPYSNGWFGGKPTLFGKHPISLDFDLPHVANGQPINKSLADLFSFGISWAHQKNHRNNYQIHPWSLTWNLKISHWKRRFLLETIILRFHVKLLGCTYSGSPARPNLKNL